MLADRIRTIDPGRYLITAAYHTPNGHLHLGHLAGPFLSGDVLARHLQTLGHEVVRITATDAFEPYVLLTALQEGRSPEEVAGDYYASARDTLAGFDLYQDAFLDLSASPWAQRYRERSRELLAQLAARGRLVTRELRLVRSTRSGRYLVGPFALGRCPDCGADAAGTSCEACGLWFTPDQLRDVRPRLDEDADPEWLSVPTRLLAAAPQFAEDHIAGRFPAEFADLLRRYLARNGPWLLASQPLGWGVEWQDPELPAEAVQVSYGLGATVAAELIAEEYQRLTGHESPFSRASTTTTLLTAGYDAVLPCMFLLATMDEQIDRQPFDVHVLNRFVQLDGQKFSTSRGHVITGPDYLRSGLSTDAFRLYAARIRPRSGEPDFSGSAFADYATSQLHDRLAALLTTCRTQPHVAGQELFGSTLDAVADALRRQAEALSLDDPDLRAGALAVEDWFAAGEAGLAAAAPYWWLKTLALLSWPFLPIWAEDAWHGLGAPGSPALAGFDTPAPNVVRWPDPLPPVRTSQLGQLRPTADDTERLPL